MINADFNGMIGLNPKIILRLIRVNVIPHLKYGRDVVGLKLKDMLILLSFHKNFLKAYNELLGSKGQDNQSASYGSSTGEIFLVDPPLLPS